MVEYYRGRRLRQSEEMRLLFSETDPLLRENLIMPYFVVETDDQSFEKEIGAMPGQYQLSLHKLEERVAKAVDNGLHSVILFGVPAVKDEQAISDSVSPMSMSPLVMWSVMKAMSWLSLLAPPCSRYSSK